MSRVTVITFSEFATLAACERRWAYRYVLGEPEQASRAMTLGTLCHRWHESWLLGDGGVLSDSWTTDRAPDGTQGDPVTLRLGEFEPEVVDKALWLRDRFIECYGAQPPSSWNVIGAESYMEREFTWGNLVGRTDGFVEIDGELWLIELKTYGARPGPLAYAQVSPQLGCYSLLAEAKYGKRPYGVIYQGVYTYQWKPGVPTQATLIEEFGHLVVDGTPLHLHTKADQRAWAKVQQADPGNWTQRPAADSFDQIEVELGAEHLRTSEQYLSAAVRRRRKLLLDGASVYPDNVFEDTLPNVGRHCSYCGFRPQCWADLGGVEPFEIEVESDDMEPV
jgi:hypothetical protein